MLLKKSKYTSLLLLNLLFLTPAMADENKSDDLKVFGQVQSRTEIDGRDFNQSTSPLFFTSLRTSIGIEKTFFDNYKFFAQVRDSRIMGESANTLTNLKNLDLHQGYFSINNIFDKQLGLQLGRFELNYGTQRFIGSVDWHYVARSFDGLKLNYSNKEFFNSNTDFFVLFPNSTNTYIGNALPKTYQDIFSVTQDNKESNQVNHEMYGFWSKINFNPQAEIDVFAWLDDYKSTKRTQIDTNGQKAWKSLVTDKKLVTMGLNHKGSYGAFSSIFEGALQVGKQDEKILDNSSQNKSNIMNSYLLSGQVFYNPLKELKFGIGSDLLSGDPNGKFNQSFETSYGTNHLFYGYMDYFINVSKDTKYLGLNDFYLTTSWKRDDFPLGINLNIHHMMSNQPFKNLRNFGQEIDLTLKYKVFEKTNVTLGASTFIPGEIFKENDFFGKGLNSLSYWSYFMISSGF
jgi:hypothetical protein